MSLKVVVTHWGALRKKYGQKGLREIERAIQNLRVADARRHLQTLVVGIDDRVAMSKYRARAVRSARDAEAAKAAVDAIERSLHPVYLMILGGPDVVPHQPLTGGVDREVPVVESDLPYACEAPFSTDARSFLGPTRKVGRLPGVTGDTDPAALLRALRTATTWRPQSRSDYVRALAISAKGMRKSTSSSLKSIFGHARDLQVVPPRDWEWPPRLIRRLAHFLNCHGDADNPDFVGEDTAEPPLAHVARYVSRKVAPGTVASVETCWGAQLYDPPSGARSLPMVNAYLNRGAYAYFGSTTVSYGPSEGNAGADLICQAFLIHVLGGDSTGHAALRARQEYYERLPADGNGAQRAVHWVDCLTLAEFALFGDPSIHPVRRRGARIRRVHEKLEADREGRRREEVERGRQLESSCVAVREAPGLRPSESLRRRMLDEIDVAFRPRAKLKSFTLHPPARVRGPAKLAARPQGGDVHTLKVQEGKDPQGRPRHVVVVARREKPPGAKRAKLVIQVLRRRGG